MKFKILLLLLLILPITLAHSHYSFEHAESLKPLINWHDYSPTAFSTSIEQNKPIFLLLTAPSWCYWCQVYESEEYLFHPDVISYINENFIPIYVDADQRQDLTRQYLEGGWPSTTILTPSKERLYGSSGPRPVDNMLPNLRNAVNQVNNRGFTSISNLEFTPTTQITLSEDNLINVINGFVSYIARSHDTLHGGFGSGQKFPQGRVLDLSLEIYGFLDEPDFLDLVTKTLENQYTNIDELETNYNLFDPVEGGFHRYGTTRDWTPPHYEKMLYDNAKLLRAYHHLLQIQPDNQLAQEVVTKTHSYIKTNWYDNVNGGFYSNTDVHGEHHYYAQNPRPSEKPRVEKTKYSDWNSEAIITYLKLYEATSNEEYKEMAEKSLDFFQREAITSKGAYHFIKEDSTKGVTGNLLDNAYLLLAFTQGYETLQDKKYLETAEKLAVYSLENFYDPYSGGFFERNSLDVELYAPGDNIVLTKPSPENGVITFALLKLFTQTNNLEYLNAALDKRNSEKLADLLNKYAEKAQYIVITHNDSVIHSASRLYGVSMRENGISNVVSLKI